ncbi:hypothetical protein M3D15_02770 [Pseudoclavibacter alba]|uniref:Flp family type IVb pilin n=1 Tax=Pseudoclavibacter albus TaxID=272241 RepID=A0ABT2HVD8_9MICO|nr:hypothetical protein [Pseudoclavibacter alba]MCT2042266.1 hypothetical protein [Pseudoclavibacter alba]
MTFVMNYLMNLVSALSDRARSERGDVPGWVLITIMSAGLVILLWTVAGELLVQVFQDAINRVSGN